MDYNPFADVWELVLILANTNLRDMPLKVLENLVYLAFSKL